MSWPDFWYGVTATLSALFVIHEFRSFSRASKKAIDEAHEEFKCEKNKRLRIDPSMVFNESWTGEFKYPRNLSVAELADLERQLLKKKYKSQKPRRSKNHIQFQTPLKGGPK